MRELERWEKALKIALERASREVPDWAQAKAGYYEVPVLAYWGSFGDVEALPSWPHVQRIVDIIEAIEAQVGVQHVQKR